MLDRSQRPFFRPGEGGIDERFGQIDLAAVAEIFREPLQETIESTGALPLLKAAMAGLVRGIAGGQIMPRGAGAQHPEHAIQHRPRIGPRASAPIGASARTKGRFEQRPLGVSEIHAARYDASRPVVTRRVTDL